MRHGHVTLLGSLEVPLVRLVMEPLAQALGQQARLLIDVLERYISFSWSIFVSEWWTELTSTEALGLERAAFMDVPPHRPTLEAAGRMKR